MTKASQSRFRRLLEKRRFWRCEPDLPADLFPIAWLGCGEDRREKAMPRSPNLANSGLVLSAPGCLLF